MCHIHHGHGTASTEQERPHGGINWRSAVKNPRLQEWNEAGQIHRELFNELARGRPRLAYMLD